MSRRRLRWPPWLLVLAIVPGLGLGGCEAVDRSSRTAAACTDVLEALDGFEDADTQSRELESFLTNADSAQNERLRSLAADARVALDGGDTPQLRSILERASEECEQQGM